MSNDYNNSLNTAAPGRAGSALPSAAEKPLFAPDSQEQRPKSAKAGLRRVLRVAASCLALLLLLAAGYYFGQLGRQQPQVVANKGTSAGKEAGSLAGWPKGFSAGHSRGQRVGWQQGYQRAYRQEVAAGNSAAPSPTFNSAQQQGANQQTDRDAGGRR